MADIFNFERLTVWQKSIEFIELIYEISKKFPIEERFSLQSQLRRAAVSIALNIAEGSGRSTQKDFKRFIHDSIGSLRETITCLHIAKKLNYIEDDQFNQAYKDGIEISKMLFGLVKKLNN